MKHIVLGFTALVAAHSVAAQQPSWQTPQDSTHRVAIVTGLAGPEAVRYDPDQDVYFVANFNGAAQGDANGFISRVTPDGAIEVLEYMTGTSAAPLHGPRGMFITGDTLWAADADGVHGFNRNTGAHVAFVDFTAYEPGFLNDVAAGPDGTLYVTDTGASRIYRLAGRSVTIAFAGQRLGPPNGITWDAGARRFVLAPWGGGDTLMAWRPGSDTLEVAFHSGGGARFDGIEFLGNRVIVASQGDSSLHVIAGFHGRPYVRTPGRPADIGIDTRRRRVAVPYIALDRVDIWQLP